jgi:uncharacterized membrane protein YqhA
MEAWMNLRSYERSVIVGSRFLTLIAVFGSLVSSTLMFALGLYNVYLAFAAGLVSDGGSKFGVSAMIFVIEALDRFLIAIVLLYFAYGVYSLFIHPEEAEEQLAIPAWLRIQQIGQLKQVVAEVIIVVLFVLFLRVSLETFGQAGAELTWMRLAMIALLPLSIFLLALSLRMVELHPKPERPVESEADRDRPRR